MYNIMYEMSCQFTRPAGSAGPGASRLRLGQPVLPLAALPRPGLCTLLTAAVTAAPFPQEPRHSLPLCL